MIKKNTGKSMINVTFFQNQSNARFIIQIHLNKMKYKERKGKIVQHLFNKN